MIVNILSCFIEAALALYFFSGFGRIRYRRQISAPVITAACVLYCVPIALNAGNAVLLPCGFVFTVLLSLLFDYRRISAVVYGVVFSVFSSLSELLTLYLISVFTDLPLQLATENPVRNIAGLIFTKGLTFMIVLIVRRITRQSFDLIKPGSFVLLLLLPTGTIGVAIAVSQYAHMMSAGTQVLYIISLTTMIIANVAVFYVFSTQAAYAQEAERSRTAERILESQRIYYEELFARQDDFRRTRHDAKNMYIALLHELRQGNTPEVEKILTEKLEEAQAAATAQTAAEYAFDAVIRAKRNNARDIPLRYNRTIIYPPQMDPVDLAIIIANILDNATENCFGDGFVDISVCSDRDKITVFCRNPSLPVDTNRLTTTKKDKNAHGFGVQSIKKITAKNCGECAFDYADGYFTVSVIIPQQDGQPR